MSKNAAMWSYNNNITQKIINGSKIEKYEKQSVTDPLFFYPENELTSDKFINLYQDE
jgi:hypothetical protein